MSQTSKSNRIASVYDITKGIPLERLAFICEAELGRKLVAFASTESAKRAAEEAYAEAFCDLAESSANEWLEQQDAEEANEIVKALRCHADPDLLCGECPYEGTSDCGRRMAADAADLIESLQAQLGDKTALLDAAIAGQETLQRALAESQSRERAAVEDMRAGIMDRACEVCAKYYNRHECDGCSFEWRGPQ